MLVPISYFDNEYLYLIAIVFERKTSSLHTLSGNKRLWLIACFISQNKKKKKKKSQEGKRKCRVVDDGKQNIPKVYL